VFSAVGAELLERDKDITRFLLDAIEVLGQALNKNVIPMLEAEVNRLLPKAFDEITPVARGDGHAPSAPELIDTR
jgi:hypothetical protein